MLDNLFAFVGVLAPDGTLQSANRAPLEGRRHTHRRRSRAEILGTGPWWNYSPQIQAQIQHAVLRAACGEVSRFDVVVRMANDVLTPIDFMLAPLRDEYGRITHLIPSAIDISARTRSEDALRHNEALLRQVVEAIPDGLMMVDDAGLIRLVNSRMESLFGYPRATLLGQHFSYLLSETQREQHQGKMKLYLQSPGEPQHGR